MAERDVIDGTATFERLGGVCDALAHMGYQKTAQALAGHVRERRGRVRAATSLPMELGRYLIALADETETLVGVLRSSATRSSASPRERRD